MRERGAEMARTPSRKGRGESEGIPSNINHVGESMEERRGEQKRQEKWTMEGAWEGRWEGATPPHQDCILIECSP